MKHFKSLLHKIIAALGVFISRLGFLPPNFSPMGSFGFFGGNVWLYLILILGFDYFIGGFYMGAIFTYLGFLMYPLLGKIAGTNIKKQASLLPLASVSFYLLSNFGSFWFFYPHTLAGLMTCYIVAVPFYSRTLVSDLVFGWGYMLVKAVHTKTLRLPKFGQLTVAKN